MFGGNISWRPTCWASCAGCASSGPGCAGVQEVRPRVQDVPTGVLDVHPRVLDVPPEWARGGEGEPAYAPGWMELVKLQSMVDSTG